MSRLFDGVDDVVTFSPGDAAALHEGAMSLVYLLKIGSSHRGGLYDGRAAGVRRFGVNPFDNGAGNVFFTIIGVGSVSVDYSSLIGEWGILAFTKAAGSAQARSHIYTYSGATWSHADMGSVGGNGVTDVDTIYVGSFDSGQFYNGNLAAIGLWTGTALADGDIEGLTDALADWEALTPSVLWDFHGPVATPITDLMGSGADQSAITGTTDDSGDDPPGFDYSLGGGRNVGADFLPFF